MLIEVGSPASFPLGAVKFEDGAGEKLCMLGLTVQHPPVQIFAQAHSKLQVSGARADKGYEQALRFLEYHRLKQQAEVEIELAIPMFVGLGSDALLGLSIGQALSWVHNLPPEKRETPALAEALGLGAQHALEVRGFEQGGLLLTDAAGKGENETPAVLRRAEIQHKEKDAWALVFHFPNTPDETPESFEADRLAALLQAAPYLSGESGHLVDQELWPAVERDDFEAFGQALQALQQINLAALARAGTSVNLSAADQGVLNVMRDNGAVTWGQSLTGVGLYGLVKGAKASQILRKKLSDHIGFFGGIVMATITDNRGAVEVVQDKNLADNKMTPLRLRRPK